MEIEVKESDGAVVIKPLERRIDVSSVAEFKGKINDLINQGKKQLIFDFSNLELIDSSGLGVLISIYRSLEGNGNVVFCNVSKTVMSLFEVTRLDHVFTFVETQEEALQKVKQ